MSYLQRFDAAAQDEQFPLVRGWMDEEPRPFFKELREYRPILETPKATLIARFDDVLEILRYPTTFSVALYRPKMGDFMLSQDETPAGFRDKAVMRAMLNRDDIPRVRKMVGEAAAAALDAGGGEIEAVAGLGRAVPIKIVQDYFGFAGAPADQLIEWSFWNQMDAFHNQPFDIVDDPDDIVRRREQALLDMKEYLKGFIQQRVVQLWAGARFDDVATRLLESEFSPGVGFTLDRIVINIGGLLIGAVETTSQAAIQAAAEILSRPDILPAAKAAAAEGPDAFDGYVWEAMRFQPISQYMFRLAERDYVLARGTDRETTIPAGTNVLPLVGSAMFDPASTPNPETFSPTRRQDNTFHLGWGHHECLGKYVALAMIPEIVRQILLRDDVEAPCPVDYKGGPFPEAWTLTYAA